VRARLPIPLTPLVGRQLELTALVELVQQPATRLVTVLGAGGIGKTRLAIAAAAALGEAAGSTPAFVDLSSIDSPLQVLPAIAGAVGAVDAGEDVERVLSERLAGASALLVLDTFEHVVDAAPGLARLLGFCPGVKVIVTSRSPLLVRGEVEFPVGPLDVDAPGGKNSSAADLFIERALAVAPALALDEEGRRLVAEICGRLEGLPLAIELAAARCRHLPLRDLRDHLEHRLEHLSGGGRDLPDRHRTMRAALDWSYALLDAPGMRLFRVLGVFRGGFSREAAVAVGGTDEAFAALDQLVDSSLITFDGAHSAAGRYRLLDVGREYALERAAAAGELAALRRRHALYYLDLAERAEPNLRGERQQQAFATLALDEANFRAATAWGLAENDAELALRLCGSLWMFWRWAGLFAEGRALLDAALALDQAPGSPSRPQALWGAGWLVFHAGDYKRTAELGAEMLALAGENAVVARNALTLMGNAALGEEHSTDAVRLLTRALEVLPAEGPPWHVATSLLNLGTAEVEAGDHDEAATHLQLALSIYRDLGDRHFTARTLAQLGYVDISRGRTVAARAHVREAMETFTSLGDGWAVAEGLEAVAALRADDMAATATVLAAAAAGIRLEIGMKPHPPDARTLARRLDRARHRVGPEEYERRWREGVAMSVDEATALALDVCDSTSI
jgi:predicted ATPase